MRARTAFVVGSAWAVNAIGQPLSNTVSYPDMAFSVTVPSGFERFNAERPTDRLLGCFRRFTHGTSQAPTVLIVARLGEEVPQRALREPELGALRRSDPPPFHFTDHRVRVFALGFALEGLQGQALEGAQGAVRLATAVPLEGPSGVDSVLVTVIAPIDRAEEAKRVFRAVLGGMRGQSSWRSPAQKVRARVQQLSGAVGLTISLAYLALALTLWRKTDRWVSARRAALRVASLSWAVYAIGFVVARTERQWVFAAQSIVIALGLWVAATRRQKPPPRSAEDVSAKPTQKIT